MDKQLPVLIRFEGSAKDYRGDWHLSDLVAFFPTEPGTNDPYTMQSYSSVGQHSHASMSYPRTLKPATHAMEKAMLAELRSVGYRNLKVIKRMTARHLADRRKALSR